ncbi:MAG: RDD family protein [Zetaproteobacteria bacterium]|nr:RDD family protein [Zetaproteobacteria bacterium]
MVKSTRKNRQTPPAINPSATPRRKAQLSSIGLRFLAAGYDFMIIIGVSMVLVGIPLTIANSALDAMPPKWLQYMLFVSVCYAYFVGLWVKGGTTTGMRPWNLRVAMVENGEPLTLATASARFAVLMITWLALSMTFLYLSGRYTHHTLFFISAAIPAISLLCMLISKRRQPLHDLVAGTGVFRLAKSDA